jgi:type I restriction enzyme S subunit
MLNKNISAQLRFPKFSDVWNHRRLGDLTKINQGLQITISERYTEQVEDSYFYITNEFLRPTSKKSYYIKNPSKSVLCSSNDVLMTRTGNTGQVVTGVEGAFHNNFFKIAFDDQELNKDFLVQFLRSHHTQHEILKLAGTSTIPDLNHSDFYKIPITLPEIIEQQKIADFLSAVDKKISLLKEKHALIEQYKKGVMQKLFSQDIRFKDENGNDFPKWSNESPRVCQRLNNLRNWNYEKIKSLYIRIS